MRMGREPRHSLMITIPRKICRELNIEKGSKLYFKLDNDRFVVSKESNFLEDALVDKERAKSAEATNEKIDSKDTTSLGILEAFENW